MLLQSPLGEQYQLDRLLHIGRDEPCQIRTADSCASRVHAAIWSDQGRVFLRDEHSLNGTFVNGTRLPAGQTRCLQPGDQVQVGQTLFTLISAPAGPPPVPCPADRETVIEPVLSVEGYAAAGPVPGRPRDQRTAGPPAGAAQATDPMTLIEPVPAAGYGAAPSPAFRAAAPHLPVSAAPSPAALGRGNRLALAAALGVLALVLLGTCAAVVILLTPAARDWVRLILGL